MGTNNLGELTAILEILKATQDAGLAGEHLHLLADSQYAINVVSKWSHGWKKRGWQKADKKPIANLEVVQAIDEAMDGRHVTFEWVRGHSGHELNEQADDRARAVAEAYQNGSPIPSGPGLSADTSAVQTSTPSDHPASPAPADFPNPATPVIEAEKAFIRAWAAADTQALRAMASPGVHRIWPTGEVSTSLEGPAPEDLRVSRIKVASISDNAHLTIYKITWPGGATRESSLWSTAETSTQLRLVWHQSTPLAISPREVPAPPS